LTGKYTFTDNETVRNKAADSKAVLIDGVLCGLEHETPRLKKMVQLQV